MYLQCVSCPKLGVTCGGPKFVAMSAHDLLEWCKLRKTFLKMSNAKLAELSGMPKGTVDRLFAGDHVDYKFDTIQPMLKALVGGTWNENPCADTQGQTDERMEEHITHLEKELAFLKGQIAFKEHQMEEKDKQIAEKDKRLAERYEFMKRKDKYILVLATALTIAVIIIITALVVDIVNPDIGFFWLERMFAPKGFSFKELFNLL